VTAGGQNYKHAAMKTIRCLTATWDCLLLLGACAPLRTPVSIKNAPVETFHADDIRQAIGRALDGQVAK